MPRPTLAALPAAVVAALLLAGCAGDGGGGRVETAGATAPDATPRVVPRATPGDVAPPRGRPSGYKALREGGKVAYQSKEFVLHPGDRDERWVLAGTAYQNDLTGLGRPDPAAPVLLLLGHQGDTPDFAGAKDSLRFVVALGDAGGAADRLDCPVAWQAGPTKLMGTTTSTFAAVLKPADVARLLAAPKAVGGLYDTSRPDGDKAWTRLAAFDLDDTGLRDRLRAFVGAE